MPEDRSIESSEPDDSGWPAGAGWQPTWASDGLSDSLFGPLPEGLETTVSELQPHPDREVRVVSYTGNGNPVFDDGIVRSVECVNADEDLYAIKLFSPTYNRESVIYRKGTNLVTIPTRIAGALNALEGEHEREMDSRKPGWGA
ncbi:hypothetical protein [Streptomyces sp. NPDC051452]|uniref:hypothetical protein n=1 Tax=Streptomyces sp. NPDC051452 TaxID=3365654 RepID=UPI0037A75A85